MLNKYAEGTKEFAERVRSVLREHNGGACTEEIRSVYFKLKAKFEHQGGVIFRIIRLTDRMLYDLSPGSRLGQHWSLDAELPEDNLYTNRENTTGRLFRIKAVAAKSDVVWHHSVAFNILFPEEEEIFMNKEGSVKLLEVVAVEGNEVPFRPDLDGARLRV